MRRLMSLFWLMLVFAASTLTIAAQQDDTTEAESFILEALATFEALPGYHYAYDMTNATTFSGKDETISNYTLLEAEGDALANGDNATDLSLATGETLDAAENTPRLHVQRVVRNGESALNFQLEDTVYEGLIDIEPGWQSYSDLIVDGDMSSLELARRMVIDTMNNAALPSDFFKYSDLITDVTELESEVLDGIEMRVFALEIDALQLMIERSKMNGQSWQEMLAQNLNALSASELSAAVRLWIGADDSLIYRGEIAESTNIPYLSAGGDSEIPYDLATRTDVTFSLSQHGETIEIEPVVFPN